MSWMKVFVVLMLAHTVFAAESPFSLEWSNPMSKGVHRIDLVDISGRGTVEVYAISFDPSRTVIVVYSIDGRELYSTIVPREAVGEYGDEDTMMATVADLDGNRFLDIISATEIRVSSINNHRLYRHQRIPEEGLERLYNRYAWMVKATGLVTSIHILDIDNDSSQEIVTSSIDDRVRVYNADGMLLFNFTLNGSIWDNTPVNADDDEGTEYLAAGFRGLYLVDDNGSLIWSKPTQDRFDKAAAYDLDGDGRPELIGLSEETIHVYDTEGNELWSYMAGKVNAIDSIGFEGLEGRQERHLLLGVDMKVAFIKPDGALAWEQDIGERVYSLDSVKYEDTVRLFVGTEDSIRSYALGDYFNINKAYMYYSKALNTYDEGEFNDTVYYSGRAAEFYFLLGLTENESQASALQTKAKGLWEAKNLLNTGEQHLSAGRYDKGVEFASRALKLYTDFGYEQGAEKARKVEGEARDKADKQVSYNKAKEEAGEYYALAEQQYITSSYTASLMNAKLALDRYQQIEDREGIQLVETLISMNKMIVEETTSTTIQLTTTTIGKQGPTADDLMMYGSLVLIVIIGLSVIAFRKGRGRPTS